MIQEIKSSSQKNGKILSNSEFAANLRKGFISKESKESKPKTDIKVLEGLSAKDMIAGKTKKNLPKRPLFGRKIFRRNVVNYQVNLKFLLPGVKSLEDVFLYLPDKVNKLPLSLFVA